MIVPDSLRKCVAFIGYRLADESFEVAGSVFFLGRGGEGDGRADVAYAVTAKHVIEQIKKLGLLTTWFRVNVKSGDAGWIEVPIEQWFFHPDDASVDVAILEVTVTEKLDHLMLPYSLCITEQVMQENEVGLGDEVFVTGLFRHHYGNRRNIPIVRIGNLACLTEEKISTRNYGEIDAYLIEARSTGGLSGSPVFLNLGITRMIQGQIKLNQAELFFYLFGLIHGHYDVRADSMDEVESDKEGRLTPERVNTGIAIVVPFDKIDEVIAAYAEDKACEQDDYTRAPILLSAAKVVFHR